MFVTSIVTDVMITLFVIAHIPEARQADPEPQQVTSWCIWMGFSSLTPSTEFLVHIPEFCDTQCSVTECWQL